MSPSLTERLVALAPGLDSRAKSLQPKVRALLMRSPRLRNALDGKWLGTPLHPALTDVPLGSWSAAAVLDLVDRRHDPGPRAADAALAIGCAAALPTALAGLSDWAHLRGEARRIATLHAAMNSAALLANLASLGLRGAEHRGLGRALSLGAYALTLAAAHLGGHLSFGLGIRVNRTAWESPPKDFTPVLDESELVGTTLRRVELGGVAVLVTRSHGGGVCAIGATCSHLGGPLDEGQRDGDTVVCPWHHSRFDLCSGEVIDSPAVFPQPRYETRVRDGKIELRPAS